MKKHMLLVAALIGCDAARSIDPFDASYRMSVEMTFDDCDGELKPPTQAIADVMRDADGKLSVAITGFNLPGLRQYGGLTLLEGGVIETQLIPKPVGEHVRTEMLDGRISDGTAEFRISTFGPIMQSGKTELCRREAVLRGAPRDLAAGGKYRTGVSVEGDSAIHLTLDAEVRDGRILAALAPDVLVFEAPIAPDGRVDVTDDVRLSNYGAAVYAVAAVKGTVTPDKVDLDITLPGSSPNEPPTYLSFHGFRRAPNASSPGNDYRAAFRKTNGCRDGEVSEGVERIELIPQDDGTLILNQESDLIALKVDGSKLSFREFDPFTESSLTYTGAFHPPDLRYTIVDHRFDGESSSCDITTEVTARARYIY